MKELEKYIDERIVELQSKFKVKSMQKVGELLLVKMKIKQIQNHIPRSIIDIKEGEYIKCTLVHQQSEKCLTKNKNYKVVRTTGYEIGGSFIAKSYTIKDDNDVLKRYRTSNSQFDII